MPCSMASAQAAISSEPMAPSECPIIDLMELTGIGVGVLAQAALERGGLVPVVLLGARAVRVDVVDGGAGRAGPRPRATPDRLGHLRAVGPQAGHVVGVAAAGEPGDLGVDVRAAARGRCSTPPGRTPRRPRRARSRCGCGRRAGRRAPASSLRGEVALMASKQATVIGEIGASVAPGDHHVRAALPDQLDGVADRVEPGGAAGGDHGDRALRRRPRQATSAAMELGTK